MDFFETGQGHTAAPRCALAGRRSARWSGVNVEVKYDDVDARALVRGVVRELDRGDFDVLVSSFDPRLLARVKAWRPVVRIALLTTPKRRWSLPLPARLPLRAPSFMRARAGPSTSIAPR